MGSNSKDFEKQTSVWVHSFLSCLGNVLKLTWFIGPWETSWPCDSNPEKRWCDTSAYLSYPSWLTMDPLIVKVQKAPLRTRVLMNVSLYSKVSYALLGGVLNMLGALLDNQEPSRIWWYTSIPRVMDLLGHKTWVKGIWLSFLFFHSGPSPKEEQRLSPKDNFINPQHLALRRVFTT